MSSCQNEHQIPSGLSTDLIFFKHLSAMSEIEEEALKEATPEGTRKYAKCFARFPADAPSEWEQFHIDDQMSSQLVFREDLQILNIDTDEEIGTVTINVSFVGEKHEMFQVRSAADATISGVRCGASSLSCVDRNFVTRQERRSEFSIPSGESLEFAATQSLYMVQEPNGSYYVSIQQRHGEDQEHEDKEVTYIPAELTKHVIGEGANLLLLRYFGVTGYKGTFDALTVLLDGKPRITTYNGSGPLTEMHNGEYASMEMVGRKIQTSRWAEDLMTTVLSNKGQEVKHVWHGWAYFYSIRPYQQIERDVTGPQGVGVVTPLHLCWEGDMEMRSKYLDRKDLRNASHRSYFLDNPVIRNMISDFVQELLLFKPNSVLPFAIHHFTSYSFDYKPGTPEYEHLGNRDSSSGELGLGASGSAGVGVDVALEYTEVSNSEHVLE